MHIALSNPVGPGMPREDKVLVDRIPRTVGDGTAGPSDAGLGTARVLRSGDARAGDTRSALP